MFESSYPVFVLSKFRERKRKERMDERLFCVWETWIPLDSQRHTVRGRTRNRITVIQECSETRIT
jgi:hypothetical protein